MLVVRSCPPGLYLLQFERAPFDPPEAILARPNHPGSLAAADAGFPAPWASPFRLAAPAIPCAATRSPERKRIQAVILVISRDDVTLSRIARDALEPRDRLRIAPDVETARPILSTEPSLVAVVLDLDAAGPAGFDFCRSSHERRSASTALLVVGSEATARDRYESFAAGACDFMAKPIDAIELGLRLRAHRALRSQPRTAPMLTLGDLQIDLGCGEVRSGDRRRTLTPHEAAILRYLSTRVGHCVPTEELLVEALGYPPRLGNPEVVRTHIRHLRQKLESDPATPRWLLNVPRVGYRIATALSPARPAASGGPVDFPAI